MLVEDDEVCNPMQIEGTKIRTSVVAFSSIVENDAVFQTMVLIDTWKAFEGPVSSFL